MTKHDIVKEVVGATELPCELTSLVVDKTFKVIVDSLAKGKNIYIRGLGTFEIQTRKEKLARDIKKNTSIMVPARKVVKFKAGGKLEEAVGKLKI